LDAHVTAVHGGRHSGDAVTSSDVFLVLRSAASVASPSVESEIAQAVKSERWIVPALVGEIPIGREGPLREWEHVDLRNYEAGLQKLIIALRRRLP
jgi:hypothetical protein